MERCFQICLSIELQTGLGGPTSNHQQTMIDLLLKLDGQATIDDFKVTLRKPVFGVLSEDKIEVC